MIIAELKVGIKAQYPGNLLDSFRMKTVMEMAIMAMVERALFILKSRIRRFM